MRSPGPLLHLAAALALAGCASPEITACIARCQTYTGDPTICQTMCTRSCDELRSSFGVDAAQCRRMQTGDPAAPASESATPPAAAMTERCADFVAFTFGCGIGRPAPDPTLDIGVQRNNELVIQQALVARCERGEPPHDEALMRCQQAAAGDCARYTACADAAVAARP